MTVTPEPTYGEQFAHFYDDLFPRNAIGSEVVGWLAEQAPDGRLVVLEIGVGTGRVAVPLAAALSATGRLERFVGLDSSPEMLERIGGDVGQDCPVTPVLADVRRWKPDVLFDLVLCVCGTLAMITDPASQARVIDDVAAALRPGGRFVVEVHHDRFVRSLHGDRTEIAVAAPYPGVRRALVSFSTLHGREWSLDHRWIDDESMTVARERSRITSVDEITGWAERAGLRVVSVAGSLDGAELTDSSPTAIVVLERPQ